MKGKLEGFEVINHVVGKLEQRLGADGLRQRCRASEVKIDEPIGSHDDMKWIILFVDQGWCLCGINIGGDGMEYARQRYNLGHFISPVIGV